MRGGVGGRLVILFRSGLGVPGGLFLHCPVGVIDILCQPTHCAESSRLTHADDFGAEASGQPAEELIAECCLIPVEASSVSIEINEIPTDVMSILHFESGQSLLCIALYIIRSEVLFEFSDEGGKVVHEWRGICRIEDEWLEECDSGASEVGQYVVDLLLVCAEAVGAITEDQAA